MCENLDNLERDLDTALAEWSDRFGAEPSEAAVARTKDAVRRELNEAWLADQPMPLPSLETLAGVKSAVRAELRKVRWQTRLVRWSPVAAAAMIIIGVGLFYNARINEETNPPSGVDKFVYVSNTVFEEDPALSALETELEALEQSIDQFGLTGDYYQSELDRLGNEVDTLETTLDRMSKASIAMQGVMG